MNKGRLLGLLQFATSLIASGQGLVFTRKENHFLQSPVKRQKTPPSAIQTPAQVPAATVQDHSANFFLSGQGPGLSCAPGFQSDGKSFKDSACLHCPVPWLGFLCPNVNFCPSEVEVWVLVRPQGSWAPYSERTPPSQTSKGRGNICQTTKQYFLFPRK